MGVRGDEGGRAEESGLILNLELVIHVVRFQSVTLRSIIMGVEQKAQEQVSQNQSMAADPKWSSQEKEKYEAAFHAAKKKQDEQKKSS